jgi:uncharacterized cysteine cluster protein YcgN (CxxCxxCC family)
MVQACYAQHNINIIQLVHVEMRTGTEKLHIIPKKILEMGQADENYVNRTKFELYKLNLHTNRLDFLGKLPISCTYTEIHEIQFTYVKFIKIIHNFIA